MTYGGSHTLRAGSLTRRLAFQTATVAAGEGVTTYTTTFTVWGSVEPLYGTRRYVAQQLDSKINGTITIRYRDDVTSSMRILLDTTRILEILSIRDPDEKHVLLQIDYHEVLD